MLLRNMKVFSAYIFLYVISYFINSMLLLDSICVCFTVSSMWLSWIMVRVDALLTIAGMEGSATQREITLAN